MRRCLVFASKVYDSVGILRVKPDMMLGMNDTSKTDISKIAFSSRVFPTADDMALWESLSAAEQRAIVERDEEAGFRSGAADPETLEDRLARVRASMANAL